MPDSGPSISTIKRLFALSGNQCAFPKCDALLTVRESLVGEICHIRGKKPGSARYASSENLDENHDFDNLILLCPLHHKVIDDDEQAYTVERLKLMKGEHEARAARIPDDEAERVAKSYV